MTTAGDYRFVDTAHRIGMRLCRDAIWSGDACNWLGWSREAVSGRILPVWRARNNTLYDGTAGIALFLARLHRFTDDPLIKRTSLGAVTQATEHSIHDLPGVGLYTGSTGLAFALLVVGIEFHDDSIVEKGVNRLEEMSQRKPESSALAVIDGSAGAIPVLIDAWRRFERQDFLDSAIRHAELLLQCGEPSDDGISWQTLPGKKRNLTGYSHGTSGIATALVELHAVTGDERYLTTARGALQYERMSFCSQQNNWPDFRKLDYFPEDGPPICLTAWCHGAPGIGLSRLRLIQLLPSDESISDDLETAIGTTRRWLNDVRIPEEGNFSLCHGLAGNAELLLSASAVLNRPELRDAAEACGTWGIDRFADRRMPWPCGVAEAGESPDLMLGLAGIGDFYLRLHDPASVRSVLLITPHSP